MGTLECGIAWNDRDGGGGGGEGSNGFRTDSGVGGSGDVKGQRGIEVEKRMGRKVHGGEMQGRGRS